MDSTQRVRSGERVSNIPLAVGQFHDCTDERAHRPRIVAEHL